MGEEIRFDLDEEGEKLATGLARVVRIDAAYGMGIAFLALGIDPALVATLRVHQREVGPPQLPGTVGGPPPMPGEHVIGEPPAADSTASRPRRERGRR